MIMVGTIIDEGASMSILSSTTWKALGSPSLLPEKQNFSGFKKGTSLPLGILPKLPITLGGNTIYIDMLVVQGPFDFNLLLHCDYVYVMEALVSSLFRVMCFPHEGKIVQLSFSNSNTATSKPSSLNGLFMLIMSLQP